MLRVEAESGFQPERVLYLGVDDITATLDQITANGGGVVFPRMVVPGVVILALFTDPAGNRMGLVELADGKPIVPPVQ
jgi:predicted enzyme related to lactoylglutathione lyase